MLSKEEKYLKIRRILKPPEENIIKKQLEEMLSVKSFTRFHIITMERFGEYILVKNEKIIIDEKNNIKFNGNIIKKETLKNKLKKQILFREEIIKEDNLHIIPDCSYEGIQRGVEEIEIEKMYEHLKTGIKILDF